MALGGTYLDHYKDVFKDTLLIELQQRGSRLEQTVMSEFMSGNKTYFDKQGKLNVYTKSARNQPKEFSDVTYERRQVQETFYEFDHILDVEDMIKSVSSPQSTIVNQAVYSLGRNKDAVIHSALGGSATVTTDGATASTALPAASKVAVANHDYDSDSGDVALTPGKLKKAIALLAGAEVDIGREPVFCIAPADQLMNLAQGVAEVTSNDYRAGKPLEGPGIFHQLSGYLGITFIQYEPLEVDGSADELIYVYSQSAVKLGIFTGLTIDIDKNKQVTGNPDMISAWEAIGATRMFEEKVIQIACDPIA